MSSALFFRRQPVLPGFTLSFGLSVLFVSAVILVPLTALPLYLSGLGWAEYWQLITDPRVLASYQVTLKAAALAAVANALIGLLLAWVLVRYRFPGRRLMDALVDLPFALPTAVAGITLTTLFASNGWLGQWFHRFDIQITYAVPGLVLAMAFTSLPFVVRALQPVLEDLSVDYEDAARTLGANRAKSFLYVVLPHLRPALITGTALAFIRSLGEFGAVIFIAGNIPFETEVTSLMIFVRLQEYDYEAAAAVASVVLATSLLLLIAVQRLQHHYLKRLQGN
ncbi:sulfate ABC transporter permease subunit CysT [Isoalcanivorax beigongshangi]|uniref:Sulfate transport system permease protein CysT n=1 Tax=Isoalcanivorax beigongshangi TaxID=3238810 RepID=A0ABV4AF43_9GAMM